MAKIRKGNRVLKVNDVAVPNYLKQGYDQVDDKGNVVKKATGGRMISLAEHNKALDEIERLKVENMKLQAEVKKLKDEAKKGA